MQLSNKKLIRGAKVDGIVFCTPEGDIETQDAVDMKEQENLRALEDYWHTKGACEGKKQGFDEGLTEGKKEGYTLGFQEGKQEGLKEGKEAGCNEGLEKGLSKAEEEFTAAIDVANKLSETLSQEKQHLLDGFKPDIVQFCMAVCEKVIRCELMNAKVMRSVIETLLQEATEVIHNEQVTIVLSTVDYEQLEHCFTEIRYDKGLISKLLFQQDTNLCQGDFRIESPIGLINYDIQRQLTELETKVLAVRDED